MAQALYTRLPTEEELAGTGFTPADYEVEAEAWPENWPAVELFLRVGTQWRAGFAGPTGLDYPALYPLLDRMRLTEEAWDEMLADVQVLERAALDAMNGRND